MFVHFNVINLTSNSGKNNNRMEGGEQAKI